MLYIHFNDPNNINFAVSKKKLNEFNHTVGKQINKKLSYI